MPTYEYQCSHCKHALEQFQSITAKPLRKCPACGKNTLRRLISVGASVIFKGTGFWQTDYRSEGYKKSAEADKKASEPAKTENKSETKSESTAETKPTAKPVEKPKPDKTHKKKD